MVDDAPNQRAAGGAAEPTRLASLAISEALDATRDIGDYLAVFTPPSGRRWYRSLSPRTLLGFSRSTDSGSADRLPANLDVAWAADQFIKAARRAEDLNSLVPRLAEVGFDPNAGRVGDIIATMLTQLIDRDVAGLSATLDGLSPRSEQMRAVVARVAAIESELRTAQTRLLLASTSSESGNVGSQ